MVAIMKNLIKIQDYEVHSFLYEAMGNFIVSNDPDIRKKFVSNGMLQLFLDSHETSAFFRIKRICSQYLNKLQQIDIQLFDLNDILVKRQMKEAANNGNNINFFPSAM